MRHLKFDDLIIAVSYRRGAQNSVNREMVKRGSVMTIISYTVIVKMLGRKNVGTAQKRLARPNIFTAQHFLGYFGLSLFVLAFFFFFFFLKTLTRASDVQPAYSLGNRKKKKLRQIFPNKIYVKIPSRKYVGP